MDKKSVLTEWQKVRYTQVFVSVFYNNSFTRRSSNKDISSSKKALLTIYQICTSHFGLVILLLLYSFIGAAIFQAVEGRQHGLSDNEKLVLARSEAISTLLNYLNVTEDDSQVLGVLQDVFESYESNLTAEYIVIVYPRAEEVWNFWGSMFYCATAYTTIGYGNMFPVTKGGKWLTIVYSLFGIPLCLITIANLGMLFTTLLFMIHKAIIKRCCCCSTSCYCCKKCSPNITNSNSNPDCLEKGDDGRLKIKDLPQDTEATHQMDVSVDGQSNAVVDVERGNTPMAVVRAANKFKTGSAFNRDNVPRSHDKGKGQQEESHGICCCCCDTNLSALVPILITVVYMLFGVLMYSRWEDWDFTDAFYFLFVSLSTIGFGDIVPVHRNFFLASGIYILFGLSLVAMSVSSLMKATSTTLEKAKEKVDMLAGKGFGVEITEAAKGSSIKISE